MNRLHIFNCSNELALASDMRDYIPPKNILRMECDLATLPVWWADDFDAVILDDEASLPEATRIAEYAGKKIFFTTKKEGYYRLCERAGRGFMPAPWGWSKSIAETFRHFGVPSDLLPTEKALNRIRKLSSKQYATIYIKELLRDAEEAGISGSLLGEKMRFETSIELPELQERTIFKSPWSSSGRGVFAGNSLQSPAIREKLIGFIKRQGGFVADKFYDKRLDFALEFKIDREKGASFIGYSVFVAADNGYYGSNIVASQETLRNMILASGVRHDVLLWVIEEHKKLLEEHFRGCYTGVIGIDMLVADVDGYTKIHPCVEINMRMNLGVAAMEIQKICGEKEVMLTPCNNGCFSASVRNSRLIIERNSMPEIVVV